ncbi:unnamed protein product [Effrenium voratum]|uniref:Uncharacterized protein n=1 Tax=Effrenium voratum TaxID=2562239 RepID=A0AA36MWB0_9DINO|nr:unnamed protein product [Effrenium voratum]
MSLRAAALFVCLSLGLLLLASDLPSVAFRRAQHAWGARRRLASKDLNLTNTLNKTRESPWQEDYVPNVTWGYEMEMDTRSSGMVRYRGCRHCAEEAFCKYASNPGCGGSAVGGVTTFRNIRHAHGCAVKPVLSIPRSYVRDLEAMGLRACATPPGPARQRRPTWSRRSSDGRCLCFVSSQPKVMPQNRCRSCCGTCPGTMQR